MANTGIVYEPNKSDFNTGNGGGIFGVLFCLGICVCVIWGAFNLGKINERISRLLPSPGVQNKNHAVERRLSEGNERDVINTRECLNKNGPALTIQNENTGRFAEVCIFYDLDRETDVFGLRICEPNGTCTFMEEVTTLVKNKMSRLPQIVRSLENQGYKVVTQMNADWLWGIIDNPVSVYNIINSMGE